MPPLNDPMDFIEQGRDISRPYRCSVIDTATLEGPDVFNVLSTSVREATNNLLQLFGHGSQLVATLV
jgi:hypothetical protein